jgi:putative CocE/NonD family hydrolase
MDDASDIRRHEDVQIPVGSETVAATRYEPVDSTEPSPAVLMYVPYPHHDRITYGAYDPLNRYLAASGYEVVVADMVGTGASTGFIDEPFTRREGIESAEIVEWLADREWTTGRIGMYGKSYGGTTALDAAAQCPDELETIVTIHAPFQGFRNAYTYGGLFELQFIGMDWLTLMQALDAQPPSNPEAGRDTLKIWRNRLNRLDDRDPWLFQFFDHEPHEAYWADKNIPVEQINIPVFAVDGWRDSYTEDTLRYVERIDAPTRVLLGPWRHQMPHRGRESAIDFRRQVRAWFDHFLTDMETNALDTPRIQAWTELDGGSTTSGCWRGFDQWPTLDGPDNDTIAFALTPQGLEDSTTYDSESVAASHQCDPTVGLASTDQYGATLASPTNDDDARTLTFDSDPLDNPVELTGTGAISLRVEPTTIDPTFVVRIVDIDHDGRGTMVTRGAVRGVYRDGLTDSNPMTPDEEHTLSIPFEPKSHVFEVGHRIRVAIGSACFPDLLSSSDSGTFTVRSNPDDPTIIEFPGDRLEQVTFNDTLPMAPPDDSIPPSPERAAGTITRETAREHVSGEATAMKTNERTVDLPHGTLTEESVYEASITEDDPSMASARNELHLTVENTLGMFEVQASNYLSHSLCRVNTTVYHDGDLVYEGSWFR